MEYKEIKAVDGKKWYSIKSIHDNKLLYWINSYQAVKNAVIADKLGNNILKTIITGTGNGTTYSIKGENIIKFIVEHEDR